FSSQEEAIEKSLEIIKIELDDKQQQQIREKAQQSIEGEKKGKEKKGETSEKKQERLIKILERKLLEKEIKRQKQLSKNSDCLECCGQKQKDKGKAKEVIAEQIGETSHQAQIQQPPK
ncbi:1838_t:CDS:2, partial [Cetraspora pellucida]